MSTKGAEIDSSPSLNHLIRTGNEKAALELITKESNLSTLYSDGYAPIHWAAKTGSRKVFKALVKKGANPYQQDREGFVAYYYMKQHNSQKHVKLLEYYEANYPLELITTLDPLNQHLDMALRNSGLHTYHILPQDNTTPQNYLYNLFASAQSPASKKRSATSKPDIKKALATLVSPAQLTQIAFGIIEELPPLEIITILNKRYAHMDENEKLACIYFVKELIRQDIASEWVNESVFIKCYDEFLQKLGNSLAMTSLRSQMMKLLSHSSATIASDLTKAFAEAILRLTPQYFQANNLIKKADANEAFQALSALTNRLSEYVCMDILLSKKSEESAAQYCFYMDVIQLCLAESNGNYAAAFAIYNGLQFNTIQRLKSITSLIPDDYQVIMRRFEELFHPSFKGLQTLMVEHPHCVPVTAYYSKCKDSISQNEDFTTRVMMYGRLNAQFAEHCKHLRSLPHLTDRYRTDICEKLEKDTYNETHAYWYSYQLEPARVIKLDNTNPEALRVDLKYCKDVHSPLAINVGNKSHRGLAARQQIIEFASQQQWVEGTSAELVTLCDEVISLCDNDMPGAIKFQNQKERRLLYKKSKLELETKVDKHLLSAMSELKLEPSSSNQIDDAPKRARSHTAVDVHQARRSEKPAKKSLKDQESSSSERFTPLADLKRQSSPKASGAVMTTEPQADQKGLLFK